MGMLEKLKSLLGLGRSQESSRRGRRGSGRDANVSVEREPSTSSEDAVKGTHTGTGRGAVDSSGGSGPTAGESGGPGTDQRSPGSTGRSEPAEGREQEEKELEEEGLEEEGLEDEELEDEELEDEELEEAPAQEAGGTEEGSATDATAESEGVQAEDVTVLTGIGSAYGERLEAVGVETVADLAEADATELAAETDLGENRVAGWIEQARER